MGCYFWASLAINQYITSMIWQNMHNWTMQGVTYGHNLSNATNTCISEISNIALSWWSYTNVHWYIVRQFVYPEDQCNRKN